MIRSGSKVDLVLPEIKEIKLLIEKGTKVKAGETIVVKWVVTSSLTSLNNVLLT